MKELDLSDCFYGEAPSLQPLSSLPLTHLILEGLPLSPTTLLPLCSLSSLLVLSLKHSIGLTDSHLLTLAPSLPVLQQLNVDVSPPLYISESALFEAVSCYLPELVVLRAPGEVLSPRVIALIPRTGLPFF